MIQKLRDLPMENEDAFQNIDEDELAQGLAHRFSQSREASKANGSHNQQVSKFHKNLKSSQGDLLVRLQEQADLADLEDCVAMLEDIGLEQQFEVFKRNINLILSKNFCFIQVTFVEVEEVSRRGLHQCMVQMSTLPVSVCYGQGDSAAEAKQSAARDGLGYLKLMTL